MAQKFIALTASILLTSIAICIAQPTTSYTIDGSHVGPVFAGIGAVSGGGATSKLLFSYPDDQLNEILDFLFLPNFGASLHYLKVEIGGDSQSTEGSEASHQRSLDDLNYERGYEWRLLEEAYKRNPSIQLGGLSWAWPAFVGVNQTSNPFLYPEIAASYIVNWAKGVRSRNLPVSVLAGWNERSVSAEYFKALRRQLDAAGFNDTRLVCGEGVHAFDCAPLAANDPELRSIIHALGGHNPPAWDRVAASTGLPVYCTECHYNAVTGTDWATYTVTAFMTRNITGIHSWAMLAAYHPELSDGDHGLFRAWWPWCGHYELIGRMWITAHHTQFTQPDTWHFLANVSGTGTLRNGGHYVSYVNPTTGDWTVVIEKMPADGRPTAETATFHLNDLASRTMYVWVSDTSQNVPVNDTRYFFIEQPSQPAGSSFTITINVGQMITVTTLATGKKGTPRQPIPPITNFPTSWTETFETCPEFQSSAYFVDQTGSFECLKSNNASHGTILQQTTPARPIAWWHREYRPLSIGGDINWVDTDFSIDIQLQNTSDIALVAVHCNVKNNPNFAIDVEEAMPGLWLQLSTQNTWYLYPFIANVSTPSAAIASGTMPLQLQIGTWYTVRLNIHTMAASASVDGMSLFNAIDTNRKVPPSGWVGIGTGDWGQYVQFDNVKVIASTS